MIQSRELIIIRQIFPFMYMSFLVIHLLLSLLVLTKSSGKINFTVVCHQLSAWIEVDTVVPWIIWGSIHRKCNWLPGIDPVPFSFSKIVSSCRPHLIHCDHLKSMHVLYSKYLKYLVFMSCECNICLTSSILWFFQKEISDFVELIRVLDRRYDFSKSLAVCESICPSCLQQWDIEQNMD
jgi:hypothetical protein